MSDRQPNPRPSIRNKSGAFAGFGDKDCCCSPKVHAWGGVRLLGAGGLILAPAFNGAYFHGACFQGRPWLNDSDPTAPTNSDAWFFPHLNIEPPTQPATHDVRPKTSVLHQPTWLRFSHTQSFSDSNPGFVAIGLGLTAEGKVYGWGNSWPLEKYNAFWSQEYNVSLWRQVASERTWSAPVELEFEIGTGVYISADATGLRGSDGLFGFGSNDKYIVLVDTDGDVHVGFFVSGQGRYEIGWNSYSLDAQDAFIVGVTNTNYRVAVLDNHGNITQLIFNRSGNSLIGTTTQQHGILTGLAFASQGSGYPFGSNTYLLSFAGGGGTGAIGTTSAPGSGTSLNPSGQLLSWRLNSVGQGYTSAPTVTIVGDNAITPGSLIASVDDSEFVSIFPFTGLGGTVGDFSFVALTARGTLCLFRSIGAELTVLDPGNSYVVAGHIETPLGGNRVYALRDNGDIVSVRLPFTESHATLSEGTEMTVLHAHDPARLQFVKAAFAGNSLQTLSVLAIDTDGRLWAVGKNNDYRLGDGTNIDRASFVQIGSHRWKHVQYGRGSNTVNSGVAHTALAIHDDDSCDQDDC
jgi:hypothetical protein